METSLWTIISTLLNLVFGGGLLVTIATIKPTKAKARAEAKASELANVEDAIKIWRETSEKLNRQLEIEQKKYTQLLNKVELLQQSMDKIHRSNTHIMRKLNSLTPDNINEVVDEIRSELKENHSTLSSANVNGDELCRLQGKAGSYKE